MSHLRGSLFCSLHLHQDLRGLHETSFADPQSQNAPLHLQAAYVNLTASRKEFAGASVWRFLLDEKKLRRSITFFHCLQVLDGGGWERARA